MNAELESKVKNVIDQIRPYLQADGGDIKFLELTEQSKVKGNRRRFFNHYAVGVFVFAHVRDFEVLGDSVGAQVAVVALIDVSLEIGNIVSKDFNGIAHGRERHFAYACKGLDCAEYGIIA